MSWKHHLSDEEKQDIEKKSAAQFAALVRKGLWMALMHHANQDRRDQGLPPLRRPAGVPISKWEQTINGKVDGVVMQIDAKTGNYGQQGVAWVDGQFKVLKQSVCGLFTMRDEK